MHPLIGDIPYGYCHCGCGQKAPLSTRTCTAGKGRNAQVKGEPKMYCDHHLPPRATAPLHVVNPETGCWEWQLSTGDGYGRMRGRGKDKGKLVLAHRAYYEHFVGPIPEGKQVLHDCPSGDNRACVNPAHLWIGTLADNMADKVSKGRHPVGEASANAKLTDRQVQEIRARFAVGGTTNTALGKEYGVSQPVISQIVRRLIWQHVADDPQLMEEWKDRPAIGPRYKGSPGARNGRAILTEEKVRDMRQRHASGQATVAQLMAEYGISKTVAHRVLKGESWKHVL